MQIAIKRASAQANRRALLRLIVLVLFLPCGAARADVVADAHAAFERADYARTLELVRPSAERGHAGAQLMLAYLYQHGKGVPRDAVDANRWLRKAAVQGNARAQYQLGLAYALAEGVARDDSQALRWLTLAVSRLPASQADKRSQWSRAIDDVAARLTGAEVTAAQEFVSRWRPALRVTPGAQRDALLAALLRDDAEQVERLLQAGADPDVSASDGEPILFKAAYTDKQAIAQSLIEHGVNLDASEDGGFTALHAAAYRGHREMVELLLRAGARVTAESSSGLRPLHKVVERFMSTEYAAAVTSVEEVGRSLAIVTALLDAGADVNAADHFGTTALHWAATTTSPDLVKSLLARGAALEVRARDDTTPLYLAAKTDRDALVEILLKAGAQPDARTSSGFTALTMAAQNGNFAVVRELVAHGAGLDIKDEYQRTPLSWALHAALVTSPAAMQSLDPKDIKARKQLEAGIANLKKEWTQVAIYLLEQGATPPAANNDTSPLYAAVMIGHLGLVKKLLERGAPLDDTASGETALHAALAERHADIARLLVNKGANVNVRNMSKRTPLHFLAVYLDDDDLAQRMIDRGAEIDAVDKQGRMPLDYALQARHSRVAFVLMRNGHPRALLIAAVLLLLSLVLSLRGIMKRLSRGKHAEAAPTVSTTSVASLLLVLATCAYQPGAVAADDMGMGRSGAESAPADSSDIGAAAGTLSARMEASYAQVGECTAQFPEMNAEMQTLMRQWESEDAKMIAGANAVMGEVYRQVPQLKAHAQQMRQKMLDVFLAWSPQRKRKFCVGLLADLRGRGWTHWREELPMAYRALESLPQAQTATESRQTFYRDPLSAQALDALRREAMQGGAELKLKLGYLYDNGDGVEVDDGEALRWYQMAADAGDSFAQLRLGVMTASGEGRTPDYVEAYKWLMIAAMRTSDARLRDAARAQRNAIAGRMAADDIAKATRLAMQWRAVTSTGGAGGMR